MQVLNILEKLNSMYVNIESAYISKV